MGGDLLDGGLLEVAHDSRRAGGADVVHVIGVPHDPDGALARRRQAPEQPQGDLTMSSGDDHMHARNLPLCPSGGRRIANVARKANNGGKH